MSITVKKLQLVPLGDKEEVNRVYDYLRSGIYNQHLMLNVYMGQLASLFYSVDMDTESELYKKGFREIFSESNDVISKVEYKLLGSHIKQLKDYAKDLEDAYKDKDKGLSSEDYKEKQKAIFRNTNKNIEFVQQAKGLGMSGNCGMRVRKDFSTALKNGLARGERSLPYYKKDYPLIAPNRFLNPYKTTETYTDKEGNEKEHDIYAFKFVNGIHFKVILGNIGKRDYYVTNLLENIIKDPDNYSIRDSSIQLVKKGKKSKIMLNLTVNINKKAEEYKPEKGRVMGLAMGYDKCLVAALSDDDNVYTIGDYYQDSIVEKRIEVQNYRQKLQKDLRDNARGGHGRKRKLAKTYNEESHERNMIRHFNHVLSKDVINFAKKHKVEAIVMEDITKADLDAYPILLRNWSYFQLQNFITYKGGDDIKVVMSKDSNGVRKICCKCGCELNAETLIPKETEWCHNISFVCPHCSEKIDYSYNKAKNMTVKG